LTCQPRISNLHQPHTRFLARPDQVLVQSSKRQAAIQSQIEVSRIVRSQAVLAAKVLNPVKNNSRGKLFQRDGERCQVIEEASDQFLRAVS